jgi:hypothetical protein
LQNIVKATYNNKKQYSHRTREWFALSTIPCRDFHSLRREIFHGLRMWTSELRHQWAAPALPEGTPASRHCSRSEVSNAKQPPLHSKIADCGPMIAWVPTELFPCGYQQIITDEFLHDYPHMAYQE